jgi:cytochrome P450
MNRFDHHTAAFARNWRADYARMRESEPVAATDAHGGYVALTRYADVRRALLSPQDFACGRDLQKHGQSGGVTIPTNPFRMGMMEMDPPESLALRRLLVPWFSARAVDAEREHIRQIVGWCIDRVIEQGRLDVVDDLANPVPALVTLDLLGLPLSNWAQYARTLHEAAYREPGSARGIAWLLDDLRATVAARRADPPDVLTPVDALLSAEIDGQPLSEDLAVELVFMLLNGGIDTSTAIIAQALLYLSRHPGDRARLAADPSAIPAAVEEFLRFFTPGTGLARTVVRDVTVGGVQLCPGQRVFLALGSANLDPEQFPDADTVRLARDPNRHVAFGAGVHRCLGSFLAAAELATLIEEVLARLPDLCVDEAGVRPYEHIPIVAGFRAMPATFTPGRRIGFTAGEDAPPSRSARQRAAAADIAATIDESNADW